MDLKNWRHPVACVVVTVLMLPLLPFCGMFWLAEWLERISQAPRNWRWASRLFDVVERVAYWADRRGEPPGGTIVTQKAGSGS